MVSNQIEFNCKCRTINPWRIANQPWSLPQPEEVRQTNQKEGEERFPACGKQALCVSRPSRKSGAGRKNSAYFAQNDDDVARAWLQHVWASPDGKLREQAPALHTMGRLVIQALHPVCFACVLLPWTASCVALCYKS